MLPVPTITAADAAVVACALPDNASLEKFISELPDELVAPYLAALLDSNTNGNALAKGLTARLIIDGQAGQHWEINGRPYGLFGAQQHGFKDIPNLFANLMLAGMSVADIASAVSEVRITDLKAAAALLKDRDQALETISEHRIAKGERGAPRFQEIVEKYVSKP